jgi:hypothetical protein
MENAQEKLDELRERAAKLSRMIRAIKRAGVTSGGYIVLAPNAHYSGSTAGVRMEEGAAFLTGRGAKSIAKALTDDFGYFTAKLEIGTVRQMIAMPVPPKPEEPKPPVWEDLASGTGQLIGEK